MAAWTIKAWPPVSSQQAAFCAASYRHVGTEVQDPRAKPGHRAGQTIWASRTEPPVAIAWDWAEICPFVVVLSDPMAILTNARIEAPPHRTLDNGDAVVAVNTVVHRLPWQRFVRRRLSELRAT